jgi:Asp-tRNA(Asn)/Glu-tRNA(Gln) amidotransferase A subunit family amidase
MSGLCRRPAHGDVCRLDRPPFVLSLTGLPVASVPCGVDDGDPPMPVGLQIVGRPQGEEDVLALAAKVQARQ